MRSSVLERAIRNLARRHGCLVKKRSVPGDNYGAYRLVNVRRNEIVLGEHFEASLEEIGAWLAERAIAPTASGS
jgi:hypothetical protein